MFVQQEKGFPNTGETCCVPSEPCTPDASSIGVEWSGNVAYQRLGHLLYIVGVLSIGSAVGVLRGIVTSSSRQKSEV